MSWPNFTPESDMEIVRFVLAVEIILGVLALAVAVIRAYGDSMARRWLSNSINATARWMNFYH